MHVFTHIRIIYAGVDRVARRQATAATHAARRHARIQQLYWPIGHAARRHCKARRLSARRPAAARGQAFGSP